LHADLTLSGIAAASMMALGCEFVANSHLLHQSISATRIQSKKFTAAKE
jgi:hypothetical protein